jgi:hypothetical protein
MDGSSKAFRINGARGEPWSGKHEVSPHGDVVFDSRQQGSYQLFRVPVDGGEPFVRLNPPMVPGGNVYGGNSANGTSFQFSPDGSWLLYIADQEVNGVNELFAVASDGDSPARKMNGPIAPDGDIVPYAFTPDSRRVLYGVWTSTSRDIFTSVFADEEAEAGSGEAPSFPQDWSRVVVDPSRMGPNADGASPEDPDGLIRRLE